MADMQAQYGLAMDQVQTDRTLRSTARAVSDVQQAIQVANIVKRQSQTGGIQQQKFIENPISRGFV